MKRFLVAAALLATASVARAQTVNVTLSEFKLELSRDTVKAGPVTFKMTNTGNMSHGFWVKGEGVDKGLTREVAVKEGGSLTVTLKPGTYEVYCPLADGSHKMAGMTKKFFVKAADAAPAKKP